MKHPDAPTFDSPEAAIAAVAARLQPVAAESLALAEAAGRILRQPLRADRDSPAADVSAMDGYAVTAADLQADAAVPISGESVPGSPPPPRRPGAVVRIFTGGVVPVGLDRVIRREETEEGETHVRFHSTARAAPAGLNIRRQGENTTVGREILAAGVSLHAGAIAAAANFGAARVEVSRPVRLALLLTGDELRSVDQSVEPWQLRDSNGLTLAALFAAPRWIEVVQQRTVGDALPAIQQAIEGALEQADAVVLTGGVSMGDYDHVPQAVRQAGGEILFHKLPVRPGKPILAAATSAGQLIVGLPGNPVSAAVGGRRFVAPWLRVLAAGTSPPPTTLTLVEAPAKTLPLHWMRLVQAQPGGRGALVVSRGSGDLVSLAGSSGFIEQPPGTNGLGPWPYWPWSVED